MIKIVLNILIAFLCITVSFSHNKVEAKNESSKFKKPTNLEELRKADINDIASLDSYDSRDYDIVTPIKNQRMFGRDTCWAYATLAASETSILREGLFYSDTRNLDLSELNHSYLTFNNDPDKDPLNLTTGDAYSGPYNKGYHMEGSSQRMLTWVTPSHEDYIENENNPNIKESAFLLEDIIKVDHTSITDIKKAIAQYGAVTVSYKLTDWHEEYYYYNSNINVFDGDNHAVTIVGWDDNVDKNLYKLPSTMNGGWIVKNSWGTSHKEGDGYFMMSYDSPIADTYAYDFASKEKYDFNYHYDSYTSRNEHLDSKSVAAIYPVLKSSVNKQEFLKSVNVSVIDTVSPKKISNAEITAQIYTNVSANSSDIYSKINNPVSGNLAASVSRKIDHEGSYTLELPTEIELEKGSFFSVVIQIKSENNRFKVALSTENYTSTNDLTFYEDSSGHYLNCGLPNQRKVARIKAFTKLKDRTEILKNDIKYTNIRLATNEKYRYGSVPDKILLNVYSDDTLLKENIDYEIIDINVRPLSNISDSSSDNDIVATGSIQIRGIGSWEGSTSIDFPVLVGFHDLSAIGELDSSNVLKMEVDGSCNKYSDIVLPDNWFFVYDSDSLNVGENIGNYIDYRGTDDKCYRRNMYPVIVNKSNIIPPKMDINDCEIKLDETSYIYDSLPQILQIEIKHGNKLLLLNKDYKIKYENNINVGEAKAIIIGINSYTGTKEIKFNITPARIDNFEVVYKPSYVYTGSEIIVNLDIIFNGNKLEINKDYIVKYENNINAGEGRIKIDGINNFSGSVIKTFKIEKANNYINSFEIINGLPKANVTFGEVIYKYYSDKECQNEIIKPVVPGKYYVKAFVLETNNYSKIESEALEYVIEDHLIETPEVDNLNNKKVITISILSTTLVVLVVSIITVSVVISKRKK